MRYALTVILTLCALAANAGDPMDAVVAGRHGLWHIADLPFDNPAVNQWRMDAGLTEVSADYSRRSDSGDIDSRYGTGEWAASAGAQTYTKYKNTTLWGYGRYLKGRSDNVVWCETADLDLLYPYVLADSVGGNLNREQYAFCGGYASTSDRWAWGASMSYLATLEYREVDPRPKNVVGCFDISVGGAYRVGGCYFAGLSFKFRKYKQNNDIDFKSELGVDKIFHLTGLGTHYNRFAGTGLSTYYDGYRYGISADVYPSDGRGGFVSLAVSRFTFDNILSDMNKLPLASAWHNEIEAQAGWLLPGEKTSYAVSANLKAYRRHGTENIFGDATSSIYPQIGSNTLFADNCCSAGVNAIVDIKNIGPLRLSAIAGGRWSRRTVAYIEPWRYTLVNNVACTLGVKGDLRLGRLWLLSLDVSFETTSPFDCSADLPDMVAGDEMRGLNALETNLFNLQSHSSQAADVTVSVARPIDTHYLLQLSAGASRRSYHNDLHSDNYTVKLSFIF